MIRLLNRDLRKHLSPKAAALLSNAWNITIEEIELTKKAAEAFSYSMKKNFPKIPSDWELISVYEAAKILDGLVSRNTLEAYKKSGWLRSQDNKVYRQEVNFLKQGIDAIKYLFDKKVLGHERQDGKKYIVLYPANVTILKQTPLDQEAIAFINIVKSDWMQDWMNVTDLSE